MKIRMHDKNMSQKTMIIVLRDGSITHSNIKSDLKAISNHRKVTESLHGYKHTMNRHIGCVWYKICDTKVSYRTEGSEKMHTVKLHHDEYGTYFIHRNHRVSIQTS